MSIEKSNQNGIAEINKLDLFLQSYGFQHYKLTAIRGDASKRRYYRVTSSRGEYVLMDASKELYSVKPFINIASILQNNGFSAPLIFNQDLDQGLLLLEDLGQTTYTRLLVDNPSQEKALYDDAIDVLIKISNLNIESNLPRYDTKLFDKGLEVFIEWYLKKTIAVTDPRIIDDLKAAISSLFKNPDKLQPVLALRDYHADNLIYLPNREGVKQVGILDFQDAVMGSPAYDVVSLLEDARRTVSTQVAESSLERYMAILSDEDKNNFLEAYTIFSLQRNLRIIGFCYRQNILYNRPKYLNYLTRVWGYVRNTLNNPLSTEVNEWFKKYNIPMR